MVLPSTVKVQAPLYGSSLVPSCRRAGQVEAQDRTRSGRCGQDGPPLSIRVTSMSKHGLPGLGGFQPCLGFAEFCVRPDKGWNFHQLVPGKAEQALDQHEL
jgi:hypothetical protein